MCLCLFTIYLISFWKWEPFICNCNVDSLCGISICRFVNRAEEMETSRFRLSFDWALTTLKWKIKIVLITYNNENAILLSERSTRNIIYFFRSSDTLKSCDTVDRNPYKRNRNKCIYNNIRSAECVVLLSAKKNYPPSGSGHTHTAQQNHRS